MPGSSEVPRSGLSTSLFRRTAVFASTSTSSLVASTDIDSIDFSKREVVVNAADQQKQSVRDSLPPSLVGQNQDCIASFKASEIIRGALLGSGSFSHVYEIKSFCIHEETSNDAQDASALNNMMDEMETRLGMKEGVRYRQTKKARYAIKQLKGELLKSCKKDNNLDMYIQAVCDLIFEAEVLASLNHPNIIKLRGTSSSGASKDAYSSFSQGPSGCFLIIDRLFETLDQRIKKWHGQDLTSNKSKRKAFVRMRACFARSKGTRNPNDNNMDEQLEVALQISSALMYLHSHSIIFRDLKPSNLGFDVRGDVKLFDLGLGRFMPIHGNHNQDTYKMSMAGSPRYMSPECLTYKPYNLKADVYSFAVLVWEMLSGNKPFASARTFEHLIHHVVAQNERPGIMDKWPGLVKDVLEASFNGVINRRPTMEAAHNKLKEALVSLRDGNEVGLSRSALLRRRSLDSAHNLRATMSREFNSHQERSTL